MDEINSFLTADSDDDEINTDATVDFNESQSYEIQDENTVDFSTSSFFQNSIPVDENASFLMSDTTITETSPNTSAIEGADFIRPAEITPDLRTQPITTESYSQTSNIFVSPQGTQSSQTSFKITEEKVHKSFDFDEFNRRMLFKMMENNSTVGSCLRNMNLDINNMNRENLDYLRNFISNFEYCKFNTTVQLKTCIISIKICKSLMTIFFPNEEESIMNDFDNILHIVENYDYTSDNLNSLAFMAPEQLTFKTISPVDRTIKLVTQTCFFRILNKMPILINKIMKKLSGSKSEEIVMENVGKKRKSDDDIELDSKKFKFGK